MARSAPLLLMPLLLLPTMAQAHLMPAQQGTVNVVDNSVFQVLSVPVSALHGFDDDHDGLLSLTELQTHSDELRREVGSRFVVTDNEQAGATVRVDIGLSPEHEAATDRAAHLLVLKHTRFGQPPADLRVHCDLFGTLPAEHQLSIVATRPGQQGREAESTLLRPGETEHQFFQNRPASTRWPTLLAGKVGHLQRYAAPFITSLLAALAAGLVWRRARRAAVTPLTP